MVVTSSPGKYGWHKMTDVLCFASGWWNEMQNTERRAGQALLSLSGARFQEMERKEGDFG